MSSMNTLPLVIYDFETGGLNTATLEPVQIAAAVLDPRSLEVVDTFNKLMRPLDMNNLDQKALDINKKTREELAVAPEQKVVWQAFAKFVKKHNKKGGPFTAPIGIGKNSDNFDFPILQRLCTTYQMVDKSGQQNLFNQRLQFDIEKILWMWFENCDDLPNYRMDTLRTYFGLTTEGAHDALVDVLQTAEIFRRFLKLHRRLKEMKNKDGEPAIKFKDSCKGM